MAEQTPGVLIGGSPSTGSSVLVNILNRHPDVVAGPETFLFMHPKLYTNWERYKHFLIRKSKVGGLKSIGWFRMNGADLLDPFYGHSPSTLRKCLESAASFPEFARDFFQPAMQAKGARIWVEKSPSNALCLDVFLKHFPSGRVIHTTRDPYDTMASLVARGYSAFYAAGAYLINTAFALRAAGEGRHFLLRYEDWVMDPQERLSACLSFLGLEWDPALLQPRDGGAPVRMEGWLHDERGPLQQGSIGRFARLSPADQHAIRAVAQRMRIAPSYRSAHALPVASIGEVCEQLGYPQKPADPATGSGFWKDRLKDRLGRAVRCYPTAWDYPVRL
jgi:hypothetical protein